MKTKTLHIIMFGTFALSLIACNSKSTSTTESAQGNLKSNDSSVSFSMEQKDDADNSDLDEPVGKIKPLIDDESHRAVAMLNYLTVQVQKILDKKENKVAIEEIYNEILNNTSPNAVDECTRNQLNTILDTINKFRLIDTDREHLQILFENDQAEALHSAMPDPTYLLSAAVSGDSLRAIASIAMTGLSSWTNYNNAKNNAKLTNLKEEWKLDEQEQNEIHDLRRDTFNYLIETVNNYGIPDEYTLNEKSVEEFVKISNTEKATNRKISLEGNEDIYSRYGPYWGLLAKTYYELDEYKNCLDAIKNYEIVRAKIFRYDNDFAMALPYAILSLEKVYGNDAKYFSEMQRYLNLLEKETPKEKWQMRYFIAQSYLSLAEKKVSIKNECLRKALEISKNDLNTLSNVQKQWFDDYLKPVDEKIADNLTKDGEKKRKEEIKKEKQRKETELIPYHEGFLTVSQLYFELAEKLRDASYDTVLSAIEEPTSIFNVRNYLLENSFDDQELNNLLKPYNFDRVTYERIYNIFKFRDTFDNKKIGDSISLLRNIISDVSEKGWTNYYLPSLWNSECSWEKDHIELRVPVCLLRENTKITYVIFEEETGTTIYEKAYAPYKVKVDTYNPQNYTACFDTPLYFKYCTVEIPCNEKMKFDKKKSYKACIWLAENEIYLRGLIYKNFGDKAEKKNNTSNFDGFHENSFFRANNQ